MTSITRRWFISYHDFPISLYLNGLQFPLISYFGNERFQGRKRQFLCMETAVSPYGYQNYLIALHIETKRFSLVI